MHKRQTLTKHNGCEEIAISDHISKLVDGYSERPKTSLM